jgi:predicted RNase H-like HicB family nuclease
MRYAIVIERAGNNFSGYVPDLPGCIATGATVEETETELLAAIQFHLNGLRENGVAAPNGASVVEYVFVPDQHCAPVDAPQAARP